MAGGASGTKQHPDHPGRKFFSSGLAFFIQSAPRVGTRPIGFLWKTGAFTYLIWGQDAPSTLSAWCSYRVSFATVG